MSALIEEYDEASTFLQAKEDFLRRILMEKPKNGRVMSQLASLLFEQQSKLLDPNGSQATELRTEAIELAERAIRVAPQKPFGYAALSMAARDWSTRKDALVRAAGLSSDRFRVARLGLWIRLLVEERDEESRTVQGRIGKGSPSHPNRRALSSTETKLYQQIQDDLTLAWRPSEKQSDNALTEPEMEFLSKQEYRLGQFFRKKMPPEISMKRARHHFEQSQRYSCSSSGHVEMATFWLATMHQTENNEDYSSTTHSPNKPIVDKCPADYIVGLYSTFAARFDELLVEKLQYKTPTKLRQLLDSVIVKKSKDEKKNQSFQRICDLGCGTGLSGSAFQDLMFMAGDKKAETAGSMVGIDLSPEMLEKAKARGCYHDLHVGDVESTLVKLSGLDHPTHKGKDGSATCPWFNLVVACDVFCYIGDLNPIVTIVSNALVGGGYFCFSTELWEGNDNKEAHAGGLTNTPGFRLQSCARFSHRERYIRDLVATHQELDCLRMQVTTIRKNQGQDVRGLLVILQKRIQ